MYRYIYAVVDKKTIFCYVDGREYDLQQKIDLEIKMREGTSKLLAACKHADQSLEAAKSLLTSDTRLAELRSELQKRKNASKTISKKQTIANGKASVSEIRIPLIWKDTDYFKNKGDYRRFAVFCLIQIGSEIYDTMMINVDRNVTDICFEDVFLFNNIKPDLQFKLFIYSRLLHEDMSIASSHKKLTQRISNSFSRSLGRRVQQIKDEYDPETGPKFHLVATANLTLKDVSDAVKTHDLVIETVDKNQELPLFGHFCCRLAVKLDCQTKEYISGLMDVCQLNKKRSINSQEKFWCNLKGFKLNCWLMNDDYPKDVSMLRQTLANAQPDMIIPINSKTKFNQEIDRLIVTNMEMSHSLKPIDGSTLDWLSYLNTTKEHFILWEPIAEYNMELASSSPKYFLRNGMTRIPGSLYDEIQEYDTPNKNNNDKESIKSDKVSYEMNGNDPF